LADVKAALVSVGDSLTQGFQSGAISRTDQPDATIIANEFVKVIRKFDISVLDIDFASVRQ
jgi:hypothetical protein